MGQTYRLTDERIAASFNASEHRSGGHNDAFQAASVSYLHETGPSLIAASE